MEVLELLHDRSKLIHRGYVQRIDPCGIVVVHCEREVAKQPAGEFPNLVVSSLVVSNLVVCNLYVFVLVCALSRPVADVRSFALICARLRSFCVRSRLERPRLAQWELQRRLRLRRSNTSSNDEKAAWAEYLLISSLR